MKSGKVFLLTTSIIVALVVTLFFAYTKILYAETQEKIVHTIKKIEIRGNQRISTAAIRSSIQVKEGDPYDPQLVSHDVDAIWSLGFFDNIEVKLEEVSGGLNVVFLVTERSVIDEIQFVGNVKIKSKKLKKQIQIKEGDYLKPYLLKLDEDKIKELYIKKCFNRIQVHGESKPVNGKTVVVFNINEGPKIRIAKIDFAGNEHFKRRKLLKQMETRQKHFPNFIFPGRFDQKKFESDIEKVKEFYMNNGWLDVDIGWEIIYSEDNKNMNILVHVKENERYYVESLNIIGASLFTEEELKDNLKLQEGGPFYLDAVEKDTYQIRLMYGEQGYIGAMVKEKHTFASEGTRVNISFNIDEKDRHYIEKIKISGNDKTRDNVIRRQLTFNPGERLDTEKIRDSQRRLTNTGYFDIESGAPAGINFEPGSEPNKQNILIDVKEGRTGMLRFGGGYGANVGAFGDISYTDRNFDVTDFPKNWNDFLQGNAFRGAGEILTLRFSPGFQRTEIMASLTNPSVFDSPYSAGTSVFDYLRFYSDYSQQTAGANVSGGRELFRDFFVKLTPEFDDIHIGDVNTSSPFQIGTITSTSGTGTPSQAVLDSMGSHLKAGLTLSAMLHKTDNIYAPTKGYEGESSIEVAGLDDNIAKFKFKTTKYNTLFEVPKWGKHVISYGGTLGIVEPTNGNSVAIYERFFAGGYGSIRGFQYRGVSPLDINTKTNTGDQIGGNILFLLSTEYLIPIYKDIIRAAIFIDSGKADETISDINFNHFRLSSGPGLRLSIPFLGRSTIAIDYGIPIIKEAGDQTQSFSFNFGGGSSF